MPVAAQDLPNKKNATSYDICSKVMENGSHKPLYENQLFVVGKKNGMEDNC